MDRFILLGACMLAIVALSTATCWIVWRRGAGTESFGQFLRAANRYRLNALSSSLHAPSDAWLEGRKDVVFCQNMTMAYGIAGIVAWIVLTGIA